MSLTSSQRCKIFGVLFLLVFLQGHNCFAKDLNGDPFRTAHESSFPQREFDSILNSLQVLANPLFGEPFSHNDAPILNNSEGKLSLLNEDFKKLLMVFPEYSESKNNIFRIDEANLKIASTLKKPWSYHASPVKNGGVAQRFQHDIFNDETTWVDLFNDYKKNTPQKVIQQAKTNMLSPIEKYEYLIGNETFNLTDEQWKEGQKYFDIYGEIPGWIGNCHGTAPATINHDRPSNSVVLKSFDGKDDITFYPSDLKKLISYAWAVNGGASAVLGNRCSRILEPSVRPSSICFDTNPGAFFLAMINLIGLHKQAIIIDSSSGNEVWNRPVFAYRYTYFRPGTRNTTSTLKHALVGRDNFKNDPYANYRSARAVSIVGVWMEIFFVKGTKATNNETDSIEKDSSDKLSYWFDLEIDAAGTVVGGEWYNINHPDFIWVVSNDYLPKTIYDGVIGTTLSEYDGRAPLIKQVTTHAKMAAKEGKVLYSIIEAMLRLSQR